MRLSSPHPQPRIEKGCVVSYCPVASSIGTRILHQGGNAVDAAVATALALAVTYPQAGNLGGGGLLLVARGRQAREVHYLDYRETAPRRLTEALLREPRDRATLPGRSLVGALAVGVPGTVAGLAEVLAKHGSWAWDRVVTPVIDLAERGMWLTARQAAYLALQESVLGLFDSTARYFLDGDRRALLPGTLFCQADLGQTLRRLAADGPGAFYRGPIAGLIADEIRRGGGVLDEEDLAGYAPRWREPLRRAVGDHEVVTASLPSGGGFVLSLSLGILEYLGGLEACAPGSPEWLHQCARAFRLAYGLRGQLAGDPDTLSEAQLAEVVALAERVVRDGDLAALEARVATAPVPPLTASNTTHFCVLDHEGNAVSNTYSLNTLFGAKLAVGGAGFLLNSCIDDFHLSDAMPNWYDLAHGDRNHLAPGRRPVSSMAPTVVFSPDGKVELLVGGSGGPRIPTVMAQIIMPVLSGQRSLEQAILAPRIHHQFNPDVLAVEQILPAATAERLEALGHRIERLPLLAIAAGIHRRADGSLTATLDTRLSGLQ